MSGTRPTAGPRWQRSAAGRIVIGLVVSQGLFYGLKQLLAAALLASQGGSWEELWLVPSNLLALQALQAFAVLAGGTMAGGGQSGGMVLGMVAGAFNGMLALAARQAPAEALPPLAAYSIPALHALVGALGGLIGKWVWRPLPEAAEGGPQVVLRKPALPRPRPLFAGPIAWVRVALGTALAVAGTLSAAWLLNAVDDWTRGRIAPANDTQEWIALWEIRALALLLGGALAGALTRNGLKQGLAVGVAASVALVGSQNAKAGAWLELAAATVLATFSLTLLGGWFGGALLPPVVPRQRRASAEV